MCFRLEFTCNDYSKIYSITRGCMVTPTRELSTPLYVISLEPKSVVVKQMMRPTKVDPRKVSPVPAEKVIQADEVSIISSGFDEQMDLLWSPEPKRKLKIFGSDLDGNVTEEISPPRLSYAFADTRERKEDIFNKLIRYRGCKVDNQQSKVEKNEKSILNNKLNTNSLPKTKVNECGKKLLDETVEEYLNSIDQDNMTKWVTNGEHAVLPRIRRKIDEGSYPNASVDEEKLPTLLRYTWKGKLMKMRKYLQDKTKHSKINRQDNQGR